MNVDLNCKLGRNTDQNYNETEIEIGDGNNTTKTVVTLPDDEVRRRLAYEESDYTDNDMKEDSDDDNVENVSKGEEDKNVEELAVEEAERQDDAEEEGEVVSDGTSEIGEDEKGRCTKSSCGYSRLHSIHRLNSHICPTEAHDLSGKPRMKTDRYDARIISSDGKLKNGINLSIKHHYYKKDDRRERIGARNYTNYPKYYSSCLKPPHLIHRNRIYHRLKLHGHSSRSHHHHPGRFFSSSLRKQIFFKRLHSSRYKPEERQDTLIKSDKISAEKHFKYIPSELKYKKEDRNKFSECERTTRFKSDKHSSSKSGNLTNLTSPTSTSMKYSAMTSSAHHDSSHRHYLKHSFHKTKNDDFDHENHKILSGQSKNTRYKTVSS
ncbi:unnamed protein product [Heterobilharzia americana]|nr:unnamed protein product [Heterobilharzia americana]